MNNTITITNKQLLKLQQLNDIKEIKKDEKSLKEYKIDTVKLMMKLSSVTGTLFSILTKNITLLPLTIGSGIFVIFVIIGAQKLIINLKKEDYKNKYNNEDFNLYTLNENIKEINKTKQIIKNSNKYNNVLNDKVTIDELNNIKMDLLNNYKYKQIEKEKLYTYK